MAHPLLYEDVIHPSLKYEKTDHILRPDRRGHNFPEKPETVLENIRELGSEILVFGPRQWESLVSMVQAHMLDAGPVRRTIYGIGMKVGREVARERTEGQRINPIWKVLFPLADVIVLKAIRDNLGLKKAYVTVS